MNLPNRKHKVLRLLSAWTLISSLFTGAFAWNKPGHMVTGAIAARELKANDSQALAAVVALLKKHPFYQRRWKPVVNQRAGLDEEAVVLFAFAARWADDARGTSDHREKAHFINFAFKPDDQPSSVTVRDPDNDNIENSFEENLATLQDSASTDVEKAKALCWLFHLTGDSHQPLHSTALFTTDFPQGDRGGTLFFVRAGNRAVKLHAQWDNMVVDSEDFQAIHDTYLNLARTIRRSSLSNVDEEDQKEWVEESFELAKEKVYLQGRLRGGKSTRTAVPLPNGYINATKPIARQRMTISGYRLADLLERLF
jgi:S1/P1 Nuclease